MFITITDDNKYFFNLLQRDNIFCKYSQFCSSYSCLLFLNTYRLTYIWAIRLRSRAQGTQREGDQMNQGAIVVDHDS